jgi:hypothetical protein
MASPLSYLHSTNMLPIPPPKKKLGKMPIRVVVLIVDLRIACLAVVVECLFGIKYYRREHGRHFTPMSHCIFLHGLGHFFRHRPVSLAGGIYKFYSNYKEFEFLGIILRVLIHEISVYNVYITK